MKKPYETPMVQRVAIRSDRPVAAICWGHVTSGRDFYHDVPGYGYCIVHMTTKGGCKKAQFVDVTFPPELNMTSQQMAAAEAYMREHFAQLFASGQNLAPYKQSDLFEAPQPDWS